MKIKQSGFTLLELMVTVAIVGIIASIAFWNSSDMLEENRAENFLLELKRNISYARSQAASTDEIVVICAAQHGEVKNQNDTMQCRNKWDKNKIIIVFIDSDNSGNYNSSTDSLLRVMEKISLEDKVKFTGNSKRLRFNTSGRITTNPGEFVFCPNNGTDNNKALSVSQSGTAFYLGDSTKTCG
ncbi:MULTISPECIES: GspH/FimT family pseudopilin [unclassified Pseudoalteromonas]|jgi:prepilin-type N-terminal cleavage/methylation domain-containing protein|uniref:GspH/FimT family pseudopilin n=1 Tax=unclassified Pseudoalteromonas TaxID=194690 RepID=UPI0007318B10|nr:MULTISPECIES: GspH/FimT family pseudopilin [unclassified Pseudoalteromonas]KTD98832.1 pilus assembly protein [Pseudoalteromonas sp. H71]MBW4965199.1 GspH/FimT family pseudopilin [Pseudoalteromonas sp. CR1]TMN85776.1 prepilin-type N-terminal cleavage/methylation domain-containing protein [Pseudoalteromonas sp. S410]TMN93104.1 prepilin-type N-terminal cleavage/methylation domain-containing protein [Pseudoalteromonas sp. S408]TMN99595.1 prepilin-type N-terminal cleavage/methylation domain-cont